MILENYIGTLNDTAIETQCSKGILISKYYKAENVSQACYELSAGNIYYDSGQNFKRIDIIDEKFGYILIKPKQSVVIITKEELNIPYNVIGRVLTKGKLFSIGLLPVNTYADPGFQGNLGIVLHNNSTNYLKIKEEELIAKIEFSVLNEPVKKNYNGQHGYKTKIWPIPIGYSLSDIEIESDSRIGSFDEEINQIYGERYSSIIKMLLGVERKLIIATIAYFTISLLILALLLKLGKADWFTPFWAILLGLFSNVISLWFITRLGKSKWFNGK